MTLDQVIFVISGGIALFGATMMISQRNPVASVLYLIVSLVAQAMIYVQLGALFLGAILVVVYAGAILVLFLFVIMLLNLRPNSEFGQPMPPLTLFTKLTIPLLLVIELLLIINRVSMGAVPSGLMREVADTFGSVPSVAKLLFTDYMYPFQLTGVLLLAAIVGAVVISRKEDSDSEPPMGADAKDAETPEEVTG